MNDRARKGTCFESTLPNFEPLFRPWSSGQFAWPQLQPSEFKSRSSLQFFSFKMFEKISRFCFKQFFRLKFQGFARR